MKTVRYLADIRMPTEKAHGWQIVQMCGAFAAAGLSVELCTPERPQADHHLGHASLFDHYGVPHTFSHRRVPDVDLLRVEARLPSSLETPLHQLHSYAWARYAVALEGRRPPPDLLYTRDLGIACRAIVGGFPLVWEVHMFPGDRGRRAIVRALRRRRPLLVVALTPFLREDLLTAGFRDREVIVESDALDPTPFLTAPDRTAARATLGLPGGPLIGFVGRFQAMEDERGLLDLIRAVALLPPALGATLVLVGGPMTAERSYRAEAARVGLAAERFLIVDRVANADVPTWLSALDIGVMPYPNTRHYAQELSPLKLFEYMGAGLPIVASDLPSLRLQLTNDENALLVPPGDPAAFTHAFARLLEAPALARSLAARARSDVRELTWDARAARILAAAGVEP